MKGFRKVYRIFVLILLIAGLLYVLSWLTIKIINKDIYLCPVGNVAIGRGECRGTGLILP